MNLLAPACPCQSVVPRRFALEADPKDPTAVRRGGHSWVVFARPLCPIARFPGLGHAHARKIGTLALTPEYYLEMDSAPAHIGPRPVADGHLPRGIALITSELLVGERTVQSVRRVAFFDRRLYECSTMPATSALGERLEWLIE
jgi:hypothetical protein